MKNFRNNFKKFRNRNNNDRSFKRNGAIQKFNDNFSDINEFKRKKFNRNGNTSKLIEKYNELAKEALSNGDKILSENYLQHADHFTRVSDEKKLNENESNLNNNNSKNENEKKLIKV